MSRAWALGASGTPRGLPKWEGAPQSHTGRRNLSPRLGACQRERPGPHCPFPAACAGWTVGVERTRAEALGLEGLECWRGRVQCWTAGSECRIVGTKGADCGGREECWGSGGRMLGRREGMPGWSRAAWGPRVGMPGPRRAAAGREGWNVGLEGWNAGGERLTVRAEPGNAGMYNQWCFYLLLACCPVGVVLSCG